MFSRVEVWLHAVVVTLVGAAAVSGCGGGGGKGGGGFVAPTPVATSLAFTTQPPSSVNPGTTFSVSVAVRDANGSTLSTASNPVTLSLATNSGGATLGGTLTVAPINGVATFAVSVSSSGSGYSLAAAASGLTGANSQTFAVNVPAGTVASALRFATTPSGFAGRSLTTVQVAVVDATGAAVTSANGPVTLALWTNPTSATLGGTTTANAQGGVATFTNVIVGSAGRGYALAATSPSLSGATSNAFDVSRIAPQTLAISGGDGQTGTVGSGLLNTCDVTVTDNTGAPAGGVLVSFSTLDGGGSCNPTTAVTNASGVAHTTWTLGTTAGTAKLLARAASALGSLASLQKTFTATAAPGAAAAMRKSNDVQNGTAGSALAKPFTVTVVDANGNPVPGVAVAFGNVVGGGSISATTPASGLSDAQGNVSATLTLGAVPGANSVDATSAGLGLATFTAGGSAGAPSVANSSLAGPGAPVANGVAVTYTVTVRDAGNVAVPNAAVTIAVTAGTQTTLTQPTALTDGLGQATFQLASTKAEAKSVTVTANGVTIFSGVLATFVAGPVDARVSTVAASPDANVTADGTAASTVTVTVLDAQANPISGATVVLAATGSNNTITQPVGATNAQGVATGSIKTTTAEAKRITATVNGAITLQQDPLVTFRAVVAVSAANTLVSANPTGGLLADGAKTATVLVTVRDGQGNAMGGQTVQLSSTGSANTISAPGTTDANGVYQGTIATTTAETKTITATINPGAGQVVATAQPQVTFAAVAPPPTKTLILWYGVSTQDNVEAGMLENLDQMETGLGAGTPNVLIKTFMSEIKNKLPGTTYAANNNARTIDVGPDGAAGQLNSPFTDLGPGFQSTTVAALTSFMHDAILANPTYTRKVLIISDHGANWTGWGIDASGAQFTLATYELALKNVTSDATLATPKFDIIASDCCTMGGLEIDLILAKYAQFRVSCENPMTGYFYQKLLPLLIADPAMSSRDLSILISQNYFANKGAGAEDDVVSAVDLSQTTALVNATKTFTTALSGQPATAPVLAAVAKARAKARKFEIFAQSPPEVVDLAGFAIGVTNDPAFDVATRNAAAAVAAAVSATTIDLQVGTKHSGAAGISIWFPAPAALQNGLANYKPLELSTTTGWGAYLEANGNAVATAFQDPAQQAGATVAQATNRSFPSPVAPATLTTTVTNPGIATFESNLVQDLGNGYYLSLGPVDWGTSLVTTTTHAWDGNLVCLGDGTTFVPVGGEVLDLSVPNLIGVSCLYTHGGKTSEAQLVVDTATQKIVSVFGVASSPGSSGSKALEVARLLPGDTVEILYEVYDASADVSNWVEGGTVLTVGASGAASLTVDSRPAAPGTYFFLFTATDPAGNESTDGVSVTK